MAVSQPARDDVRVEGIAEWMERRRREVAARRREVELAGRAEWVAAGPGQASWPTARTQVQPVAYQPSQGARSATPAPTARPRTVQEDEMTRLRREQAAFKEIVREESSRNIWMAIPALAPLAVPLLSEGAALLAGRLAAPQIRPSPMNFLQQEAGLALKPPLARPSPVVRPSPKPRAEVEENAIRRAARERYARAYGGRASDWAGQVHHRVALRFRELFPNADPNRLANLQALEEEAHLVVTRATEAWVRGLGRAPTQAEVMAHTLRMDKLVEPYILRAGIPRPPPIPKR